MPSLSELGHSYRRTRATLALGAALLQVQHPLETPEPPPVVASSSQRETDSSPQTAPIEKSCKGTDATDFVEIKKSQDSCLAAQKLGEIVVVDFRNDIKTARELIPSVKGILKYQTDSMLTPSIKVVSASNEAQRDMEQNVKDNGGCLNEWTGKLAENSMPIAKNADFVVGISPSPNCMPASGLGEFRGRYADLFDNSPVTFAHEVGHLYGLGHIGDVKIAHSEYEYRNKVTPEAPAISLPYQLSFGKHIYEELGDLNVMGDLQIYNEFVSGDEKFIEPNPLQLDQLKKLSGQSPFRKSITQETLTINSYDGENHVYGYMELPEPIKLSYSTKPKGRTKQYEGLAVIPQFRNGYSAGFDLYLTDNEGMSARVVSGQGEPPYKQYNTLIEGTVFPITLNFGPNPTRLQIRTNLNKVQMCTTPAFRVTYVPELECPKGQGLF